MTHYDDYPVAPRPQLDDEGLFVQIPANLCYALSRDYFERTGKANFTGLMIHAALVTLIRKHLYQLHDQEKKEIIADGDTMWRPYVKLRPSDMRRHLYYLTDRTIRSYLDELENEFDLIIRVRAKTKSGAVDKRFSFFTVREERYRELVDHTEYPTIVLQDEDDYHG